MSQLRCLARQLAVFVWSLERSTDFKFDFYIIGIHVIIEVVGVMGSPRGNVENG